MGLPMQTEGSGPMAPTRFDTFDLAAHNNGKWR